MDDEGGRWTMVTICVLTYFLMRRICWILGNDDIDLMGGLGNMKSDVLMNVQIAIR